MRKILVLRGGALGDFIVTLPTLAALRQRWPAARIELVGNRAAAELGLAYGFLDEAHSQHDARWMPLFGEEPLPSELRTWLGGFDLVVNYWPDPDSTLKRHFPLHAGQTVISGAATPQIAPAAAHYLSALIPIGITGSAVHVTLPARTPLPSPRGIAIHPGSGSPKKNWPRDRWLELIRQLREPVLLVLGEVEGSEWRDPAATPLPPGSEIADRWPLPRLADALSRCRLFAGHDSGVSHLAAACGTPCVLLFGATDPAVWAPPAPNVTVLRDPDDLAATKVADVYAAVTARS